jgi:pyrroloquinoline quinone biosynthesis protein D
LEVLKLVDGVRTVGDIADSLASRYDAARDVIASDVAAMLEELARKGAIQL